VKKQEYNNLLKIGETQLPDPSLMENGWDGEDKGMCKWPPIFQVLIAEFLLTGEQVKTDLSKRLISDYKEGKAYSYFTSNWLKEVFYHDISSSSRYCFLKSETTPSHLKGEQFTKQNQHAWRPKLQSTLGLKQSRLLLVHFVSISNYWPRIKDV
jgi:hypothetical protein